MDMKEGIIARFRTMAISRAAVLNGHVLGSMAQTLVGLMGVLALALGIGFRPSAGPVQWLAVAGLMALITLAMTWLSVALAMYAKGVESASNLPLPLVLLPFPGSGFVPTDSMPAAMRWCADNQPFTPFIDVTRALLTDTPMGNSGWVGIAWCVAIVVGSYIWAIALYNRKNHSLSSSPTGGLATPPRAHRTYIPRQRVFLVVRRTGGGASGGQLHGTALVGRP